MSNKISNRTYGLIAAGICLACAILLAAYANSAVGLIAFVAIPSMILIMRIVAAMQDR